MNFFSYAKYLYHGNGPQSPTMEYIDMKRLAHLPGANIAGYGRPPADNNRATTTANGEIASTKVPVEPPVAIRSNIEFCQVTTQTFAFATLGDPNLVNTTIAYQCIYNTDNTVSFKVIDASGVAEIKMNDTIILERTYSFTFVYGFYAQSGMPSASKAAYMGIFVQGRLAKTTIISDSGGAVPFAPPLSPPNPINTAADLQLASVDPLAALGIMCQCGYNILAIIIGAAIALAKQKGTLIGHNTGAAITSTAGVISSTVGSAQSLDDPHMHGFNGEDFFFNGEWNKWFNMLSSPDIQMNAYFTYWQTSGDEKLTAMRKFGFMIYNSKGKLHKIEVDCDGFINIDDERVEDVKKFKDDDFIIRVNDIDVVRFLNSRENMGRPEHMYVDKTISLENGNCIIYIACVKDNVNDPALSMRVDLKNKNYRMHGVSGQTSYYIDKPRRISTGLQGEGIIEGTHLDYEVSNIWGTDFKYNRFEVINA